METRQFNIILSVALFASFIVSGCAFTTPTPTQMTVELLPTASKPTQTMPLQRTATPAPTLAPTSTASPEPIVVEDDRGQEIFLPGPAQRVISLAPSNTELLFYIGAGTQMVGRDTFSDFPETALQIPDIGGGWGELNSEQIVSLGPDLILAAQINAPEQVLALEQLGLTVYYLNNPKDFAGLYANLNKVARLTGREREAETLIEGLKARVAAVETQLALISDPPLVFYELDSSDPNAPWTTGPGTFIDLLINLAGGENLGGSLDGEWVQISVESLIIQDPEIILLGDYTWGGVTPEDVAARPGWDVLSAVENLKVYPFDDNLASRPGPRLVDGLEAMARLFHPTLFP